MTQLFIDLETRASIDLMKTSAYRYTEDPDFYILMAAWAVDDDPVQIAIGHEEIKAIPGLWDPLVEKIAHNANFERICISRLSGFRTGKYLSPAEWTDTQALAAEAGYPQKLENLAPAVGAEHKDTEGKRLIKLFCTPNKDGTFNNAETHPEEWKLFCDYCIQDVVTLRDVHKRLPSWPNTAEKDIWITDAHVNDNGIPVDTELAEIAVQVADDNRMVQELEIMELTGVKNPGSGPQMLKWLKSQGVSIDNMQAKTITALLETELADDVRRVLELRQELALVAAKKYQAALDRVNSDGRLRGSFQFFGAHTGRWAGRGVQLQNLPSATIQPKGGEDVDTAIAAEVLDLKMGNGTDAHTLKALVRAMFTGPLTVVDYSAIEARVIAWLAGEEWALQAFRDGRDIYVETAERMGGLTRKEGKVAVLALGFQGGINSLKVMGAEGEDRKLQFLVEQWRNANKRIVRLWYEMQDAFEDGGMVGKHMRVEAKGEERKIWLPSGRAIHYHKVRWERYRMVDPKTGRYKMKEGWRFQDPKTPARIGTYGGRLCENVTQAVARDIIAEAMVRLDNVGIKPVLHVHDEIGVEGNHAVDVVKEIMVESPEWAKGLPINAEGFTAPRYRKD